MTWIKICGMTNLEDALTAVEAGVDAVGFVFYEKSLRNVTVDVAREIVTNLPESTEKIGVFVNESPAQLSAIAKHVGLTGVQLHGDEYQKPEAYLMERNVFLCVPAHRAIERKDASPAGSLLNFPENLRAIMLDSGTSVQRGGTGTNFNWQEAKAWVSAMKRFHPVVVAGGLRPENVGNAIGILQPWGVDVASGVESRPGKKDPEKVRAFVKAVREVESKTG